MKKLYYGYCGYCGESLENGCGCERETTEQQIEEIEERQHQSGFYAFQDEMENWRMER